MTNHTCKTCKSYKSTTRTFGKCLEQSEYNQGDGTDTYIYVSKNASPCEKHSELKNKPNSEPKKESK